MSEPTYPIIQIYPTIQGQGYRTGEPIIMVRTGHNPNLKYLYLQPIREAPIQMMTPEEITEKCKSFNRISWIFFGGEDPAFLEFDYLAEALHNGDFKVWVDTCGVAPLKRMLVDHLSVGPKPGMPVQETMVSRADDLRFYWDYENQDAWESNLERCLKIAPPSIPIQVMPRRLDKKCIEGTIKYVLDLKRRNLDFNILADVPLYRLLPDFDAFLCEGESCPICNYLDQKASRRRKKK